MEVVTVRVRESYVMPRLCCACGAAAGAQTVSASKSVSRGRRWESVTLKFPVCDACARVGASARQAVGRRRAVGFLGGLGLSAPLCLLALPAFEVSPLLGVAAVLALAVLGGMIGRWLAWQWPRRLRDAYRRVCGAVQVTRYQPGFLGAGRASLGFANEEFASLFRQMNADAVATRPTASELLATLLLVLMLLAMLAAGSYLLYNAIAFRELAIANTVWEQPVLLVLGSALVAPALVALVAFAARALLRLVVRRR